ncbi:MAG TPA: ABC transporter ATP-binding protein [Anaeromyxobacteraceae bacterium]|nr:ABC transporter ATP-binding protein [Anaeromyxobacteraceae bacterium]
MSRVVLECAGLGKRFGDFAAVTDVTYALREGEAAGVIGPNGAGKSTFFNLLTGLHRPTTGRVVLEGRDVTSTGPHARVRMGLARTFQLVSVFDSLAAVDNLVLSVLRAREHPPAAWRFMLGRARAEDTLQEALAALDRVGLRGKAGVRVAELSYGEKRKLEIAVALSLRPRVLLLDEPLAGLSDGEIVEVLGLVRALRGELSLVLIEHKISHVLDLVERLTVMHEGRIIAEGPPDAILRDATVRRVYWGDGARQSTRRAAIGGEG